MLAFVEGSMERQFINANFKYMHVVPVQNGITWTVDRLCAQIETAYSALNYNGITIVWLDREGRPQTAAVIRDHIRMMLINAGASPANIHVLINDKMSENVILADETAIREEFNDPEFVYNLEGMNGKRYLSERYNAQGDNYKEMLQGVRLLKKIRLSRSAQRSQSVHSFVTDFNAAGLNCWWV